MCKDKIKVLLNNKYFIPVIIISINLIFFILCNIIFNFRYETVDDFLIMKIISKLDGTYSFYSIHIHPILSYLIMLLYKTGINLNFYTIFLLTLQFISFSTIGIILLNKNKKIGIICYIFIILTIYIRMLVIINYTSVAAITILAGIICLMYYSENNNKKSKIQGIILVLIGTMLRWNSCIIVLPFYFIYVVYYTIKNKNYKNVKLFSIILGIIMLIYISNFIIYKLNPVYEKYTKFNNIRTYLFDFNIVDYEKNKEVFDKSNWSYTDWELFYTYSFADEKFYTTENLYNLKENLDNNLDIQINKIISTFFVLINSTVNQLDIFLLFIGFCIFLFIQLTNKNNRLITIGYFVIHILINYILAYTKPMYRVLVPLYATTFVLNSYILTQINYKDIKKSLINNILTILTLYVSVIYLLINIKLIYRTRKQYNKENYTTVKEIIEYTNEHKENAYIYSNILGNASLSYSIYEKLPDDMLSNLRAMGDWDIYNQEYYDFKTRYNLDNIIEDLYKKDNLYIITGDVAGANNKLYINNISTIQQYIKEHYNKNVYYKLIKEFSNSIKIYKIYENDTER